MPPYQHSKKTFRNIQNFSNFKNIRFLTYPVTPWHARHVRKKSNSALMNILQSIRRYLILQDDCLQSCKRAPTNWEKKNQYLRWDILNIINIVETRRHDGKNLIKIWKRGQIRVIRSMTNMTGSTANELKTLLSPKQRIGQLQEHRRYIKSSVLGFMYTTVGI